MEMSETFNDFLSLKWNLLLPGVFLLIKLLDFVQGCKRLQLISYQTNKGNII